MDVALNLIKEMTFGVMIRVCTFVGLLGMAPYKVPRKYTHFFPV